MSINLRSGTRTAIPLLNIQVLTPLVVCLMTVAPAGAQNGPRAEELSARFRKATEKIAPAVVGVRPIATQMGVAPFPGVSIRPGVGNRPMFSRPVEMEAGVVGSGVVIEAGRGLILTSEGVLRGTSQATVILGNGRELASERIVRDPRSNLALIVVSNPASPDGAPIGQAEWSDSPNPSTGDWVVAVGRVLGRQTFLSSGTVSGRGRAPLGIGLDEVILTDAVINPSSAGGALVDLDGKLVGINGAGAGAGSPLEGMSFAIPGDVARRVASDLADFGRVRRGYLGLTLNSTPVLSSDPRVPGSRVVVTEVVPGSPADQAGCRPGDRIVAVDAQSIRDAADVGEIVERATIGDELAISIERGGKRQEMKVRTAARPGLAPVVVGSEPSGVPGVPRNRIRLRPGNGRLLPPTRPGTKPTKPPQDGSPPIESTPAAPEPRPKTHEPKPQVTPGPAPDLPEALPPVDQPPAAPGEPGKPKSGIN